MVFALASIGFLPIITLQCIIGEGIGKIYNKFTYGNSFMFCTLEQKRKMLLNVGSITINY